ncbi:hypothetical protein JZ751_029768 [Albula glossodonta]|uniref:Uncharacterized protein n=1 Tax=Albula glossodonta TaxID=121402 RepID=A0A8T2NCU2_9TELE|nr:hypothetical protein JZ751_029768 [Albula glossodonta]
MATQCRSSKCTAERKGFRRELDSWRHKLVHCVGPYSHCQFTSVDSNRRNPTSSSSSGPTFLRAVIRTFL